MSRESRLLRSAESCESNKPRIQGVYSSFIRNLLRMGEVLHDSGNKMC